MKAQDATILIIDDSAESIYLLSELLQAHYRVLAANSGEEGLRVAGGMPQPDLILLDVMMPDMDGYAVLARLGENPVTRDIPVIFLTALNEAADVERGLLLGAADYISKPVVPVVVLARVKTQLEAKRLRDRLKFQNELLEAEVGRRTAQLVKAQNRLHELAAHLLTAREEERSGIAQEIHDVLGGALLNLKMETYRLETGLLEHAETATLLAHVQALSQEVDQAASITRELITGLRPPILDKLGLLAALEWQAGQFHKHSGIACQVNCIGDRGGLDKLRSIKLFRICQESLNNVAKHSGASRVEIEYFHGDDEVLLSVTDNGCGMTETRAADSTHFGLRGMSERIGLLGGKISFTRPEGGGLSVTVTLPLLDTTGATA